MVDEQLIAAAVEAGLTKPGRGRGPGGQLDPRTRKQYAKAWVDAEAWAVARHIRPVIPWSSETLALYARALLERGYAKGTVDVRLSGVKAKHRERGLPVPDGVAAWYVLRAANHTALDPAKVNTPRPRRAALADMAAALDANEPKGCRDLALAALGWDIHAKVVELCRIDIEHVAAVGDGLAVRLPSRRGKVLLVGHVHEPVDVCPVEAVQAWLGHLFGVGIRSGPLFRAVDKGGNISGTGRKAGPSSPDHRLGLSSVQDIWGELVVKGGLPSGSRAADMRQASALDAAANGVPLGDIMDRGGWSKSNGTILVKLLKAAEGVPQ